MAKASQVAALPLRRRRDGSLWVLLVTSRDTGRWVIPKGWRWPGHSDSEASAREAWEEAGVTGTIGSKRIGRFKYKKRLQRSEIAVTVDVYRLDVERAVRAWPEGHYRKRRWFRLSEAAELVDERDLKALLLRLTH
jgi:8-oxo-dGTP pyrophosphatase MutT (NUDIX family)